MKYLLIAVSIFFAVSVFAANTTNEALQEKSITCIHKDVSYEFIFDYNLNTLKEKNRKLADALMFEEYLYSQIRVENEKYDSLAMKRMLGPRATSTRRAIKVEMSRQYQITMDLLSQAELLSEYINWLR